MKSTGGKKNQNKQQNLRLLKTMVLSVLSVPSLKQSDQTALAEASKRCSLNCLGLFLIF